MHVGGTNAPTRRVPLAAAILALILAGTLHGGPGEASELEDRPAASRNQHVRRVVREVELSPRLGPPGTRVILRASLLPALTPVQLVIGGTQSGFEGLALGQTDADGNFEGVVEVPSWSKRDQLHRFIVFNLYFSTVLAESAIFHVTDADGVVVRNGELGSSGSECTTLEGDDGERYRLIGATDELEAGNRVVVEGVLSESDEGCGEGLSLDLTLISIR
ncbi:MAG: hypothetical protein IH849_12795 [Acidobacteria bacterium]|nr:hypothetical protein [Acidobacteriota bacterium]